MKNYIVCVIANLLFACASYPMGKPCNCEQVVLPPKPRVESCIANADGTMFCNGVLFPAVNSYCRSPDQDAAIVNWIEDAWSRVNGQ